MFPKLLVVALGVIVAAASGTAQVRHTAVDASNLYYAAEYEEALSVLEALEGTNTSEARSIELLRAACLLALGRATEADEAFERLVLLAPDLRPDQLAMTPWIVSRFSVVRDRVLTQGAQRRQALERRTPEPVLMPAQPDYYTINDAAVVRPVAISEGVPEPPDVKGVDFTGIINVQVDIKADGSVEQVSVASDVHPVYREMVRREAEKWHYRPATLNAQPVKFRKALTIEIR